MFDSIFSITIIISTLNLGVGLAVFIKNVKNKTNQYFLLLTTAITAWVLSNFVSNIVKSENLAILFAKITYAFAALVAYAFLLFAFNFPKERVGKDFYVGVLLGVPLIILFILIFFDKIIGSEVNFVYPTVYVSLGKNFFLFPLFFLSYIFISFSLLLIKFKTSKDIERVQLKFFFVFTLLAVAVGIFFNLVLYGIWNMGYATHFGPLGTILMVAGLAYAISRHNLFNIRVIATEFLVSIVGVILLIDLLSSQTISTILLKSVILLAFVYMGILLLRSVYSEIKRREEIEKIDKAKSEFISIASHQLRTPLTAIKGYISMIIDGTYGKMPEALARPMDNVYQSNERLIRLVNDLLNLSRLDAGKIKFEPAMISIEEMIQVIVDELKINAEKRGLYIKTEKPKEPLPKLLIDQDKLRQVVLNIVDNAIKYTKEGGITIKMVKLADWVQVRISDTGMGITPEELASLFKMFSRASAGNQLNTEGAGIGLHVAKEFVALHKGRIWAESLGRGKGSTFIIELPINLDWHLSRDKADKKVVSVVKNV